ncbi:MAG: glycosyltransferase [Planctomycetota bacterium]|nr:MAG: glycosyltransferase [Planctomycetota bacterium]
MITLMKILALLPRFPYPPTRGDAVRSWSEIAHLARRHAVWLACVDERTPADDAIAAVRGMFRAVEVLPRSTWAGMRRGAASLLRGRSLTEAFFHQPQLAALLRCWNTEVRFDAVFAFSSAMAPYTRYVNAARRVLDLSDVDSDKWAVYADQAAGPLRWLYRREHRLVRRLERVAAAEHDVCLVVNQRERAKLHKVNENAECRVLPVPIASESGTTDPLPKAPRVGFIGSLFYPPNAAAAAWFIRRVWPIVRAQRPDAEFVLAGARPTRAVWRLSRTAGVRLIPNPHDAAEILNSLRVFVDPVREELGVQVKLLHALAAGRACVATSAAAGGLQSPDDPPCLVADDADTFAERVVELLTNDRAAALLARAARTYVRVHHAPERVLDVLDACVAGDSRRACPVQLACLDADRGWRAPAPA